MWFPQIEVFAADFVLSQENPDLKDMQLWEGLRREISTKYMFEATTEEVQNLCVSSLANSIPRNLELDIILNTDDNDNADTLMEKAISILPSLKASYKKKLNSDGIDNELVKYPDLFKGQTFFLPRSKNVCKEAQRIAMKLLIEAHGGMCSKNEVGLPGNVIVLATGDEEGNMIRIKIWYNPKIAKIRLIKHCIKNNKPIDTALLNKFLWNPPESFWRSGYRPEDFD